MFWINNDRNGPRNGPNNGPTKDFRMRVAISDLRASITQQVGSKIKKMLLSAYLFCRLGSRMVLHRVESGTTGFHLSKNTK